MKTHRLRIDLVDANHGRWHLREDVTPNLSRLTEELQLAGQREPIVVRPAPGPATRYELITGSRRLAAATALGWTTILATEVQATDAEAATLALADEFTQSLPQTYLERGWAAAEARQLRREAGLPTGIRAMAEACGVSRSTMANALRVGESLKKPIVRSVVEELQVPLQSVIRIPQGTLLEVVKGEGELRKRFRTALTRYLSGEERGTNGLNGAVASHSSASQRTILFEGDHLHVIASPRGEVSLSAPTGPLSRGDAQQVAAELRKAAASIHRGSAPGVQSVQSVQVLDGQWHATTTAWMAVVSRRARDWISHRITSLASWIRERLRRPSRLDPERPNRTGS